MKEAKKLNNAETQALNIPVVSGSTWFKTEQIETAVNVNGDMTAEQIKACRKKLIVLHECCEDKEALIGQLETMILGLKTNFDWFAS